MQEIDLTTVKPDIQKILLVGKEGTGKTNFIKTMPKPIYLFSFDKGYLTLAGEEGIQVGLCMDEDRYRPKGFREFKRQFDALKAGTVKYKGQTPYKTIALDNITFLSTMLYDDLQALNSNIDKPGGYAVYGLVKSKMRDIINQCIVIAPHVVCTALVDANKDEISGEIFFTPDMVGSMKNEIGAWFDAVFYTDVDKKPNGEKHFKLITVGERRQKAKIRVPSRIANAINPVEEPDYTKLMAKINAAQAAQK